MSNELLSNFRTAMPKLLYRGTVGNGTNPTVRASGAVASSTTGTATTLAATVPAGVQAGDIILYVVALTVSSAGITAPGGYTQINGNGTLPAIYQFAKVATGTESGTTPAASWTSGQTCAAIVSVIAGADTTDGLLTATRASISNALTQLTIGLANQPIGTRPSGGGIGWLQYVTMTYTGSGSYNGAGSLQTVSSNFIASGFTFINGQAPGNSTGGQTANYGQTGNISRADLTFWSAAPPPAYTCPANTRAVIEEIVLANTALSIAGATAVDIILGGQVLMPGVSIPYAAGGANSVKVPLDQEMVAGESLTLLLTQAGNYTDTGIRAAVSGREVY